MKQKNITHPVVIRLLENIIDDTPMKSSGTYNRQDPTYYEKGEQVFEYKGKHFLFKYNDCTWGIEITISRVTFFPYSNKIWKHCKIGGFYLSRESHYINGHWENYTEVILRQKTSKGLFRLLAKAFPKCMKPDFIGYKRRQEEDNEMWIDPAGGVHHGYEGDPAAMYQ